MAVTDLSDEDNSESDLQKLFHAIVTKRLDDTRVKGIISRMANTSLSSDRNVGKTGGVITGKFFDSYEAMAVMVKSMQRRADEVVSNAIKNGQEQLPQLWER